MTDTTENNEDTYTGTGANTVLATTFPFIDETDLVVTQRVTATGVETVLTLSTHYTVTGGSYVKGEVTPVDGATDFPTTVTWNIKRATPLTQNSDYVENDDFGAETHEKALDKLTYAVIDLEEKLGRSLQVPTSDADPGELPNSVDRASKYLGFDASADPIALGAPTDTAVVSAFMETVLDDADAAAARATLDAQQDVITTRGDLVHGTTGGLPARLAKGADGHYLKSTSTSVFWTSFSAGVVAEQALPRGHLAGLTITRTSATEFNVNKGACRCGSSSDQDLQDAENTNAAFGKTFLDPTGDPWAAGDGQPGIPAAAGFAAAIDTWHYFMLVAQDGTAYDFGWDTDPDAANLIADSDVEAALGASCYYRRLHSFVSTATPDFADFDNFGDQILLDVAVQDIGAATPGTNVVTHTLPSVPDGIRVDVLVSVTFDKDATSFHKVGHGDISTLAAPDANDYDVVVILGGRSTVWTGALRTNTSQQIKTRSDVDPDNVDIQVRGWADRRGRDD